MAFKGRLITGYDVNEIQSLYSSELAEYLLSLGDKGMYIMYKKKTYSIIELLKTDKKIVLMSEIGRSQDTLTADYLADELKDSLGEKVFIEVDGELIHVKSLRDNYIKAETDEDDEEVDEEILEVKFDDEE